MSRNDNSSSFSVEQAMNFAKSPAGQQLIKMLQQKDAARLSKAAEMAVAGKTDQARDSLSSILSDPQIQALLKQFGG